MKRHIILIVLILAWIALFFVPHAKASAPDVSIKIPVELQSDPVKSYAYKTVALAWGEDNWQSFNNIITRESNWDCESKNPKSSAYGLGQLLSSTRKYLGLTKSDSCFSQIDEAVIYIENRYTTPVTAWRFWKSNLYY